MTAKQAKAKLQALAARVDKLCPRRLEPEVFHTEKSQIVSDLRRLAGVVGELDQVQPSTFFHSRPDGADARLRARPTPANDNTPWIAT